MAFIFAYSLDGDGAIAVKDFPVDTAANYKLAAGTNDQKKGDLVFQSAGLVRRSVVTTGVALGVTEGGAFTGLVSAGQPYAATNASQTAEIANLAYNPNGIAKVRIDKSSVYRVPVKAGQTATNANLGVSYAIFLDAAGDQTVDIATVTTPAVKVLDRSMDGKTLFVTLL
jgi:hypothetical protein